MLLESLLAYAHIASILGLVVFLTSEAALCRMEWINAAVVHRLVRVDVLYLVSAVAVLATGIARTAWGMKGMGWYWTQPLLHAKLGLFVVIGLMSAVPTRAFLRWRRELATTGALPSEPEVRRARRWVMIEAHLLLLVPLLAAFLARGIGTR
jgi:putative membrane protein